jgi:dehydrogenase/reductase SDR family member 7B
VGRRPVKCKCNSLDSAGIHANGGHQRRADIVIDQSGKTAWVTGASSGIGEALARAFVAGGGHCVLSGRNVAELNRVAAESGAADRCMILPFETTDYSILPSVVQAATGFRGQIDVLVNNAGISQRSLAVDTVFAVYDKIIAVDLLAPIALTQALLPHFVSNGAGQLIMISSVAGKIGAPLRTAYSAAKHGLIGYSDSLRAEIAGQDIKVLVVTPGSIRTNVSRNALNADGSARGVSDKAIDNGIDPAVAAQMMWDAAQAGMRELLIAEGMEAEMPKLRAHDPEKLFDMVEALVAGGYASKMAHEV